MQVNTAFYHTFVVRQFDIDKLAIRVHSGARKWRCRFLNKRFAHDRAANKKKTGLKKANRERLSSPDILLTIPVQRGNNAGYSSFAERKCTTVRCAREN